MIKKTRQVKIKVKKITDKSINKLTNPKDNKELYLQDLKKIKVNEFGAKIK